MAREEFHPDAHPEATEITGDRDYGEWGQCVVDPASSTGERCTQPAKAPHGKCHSHGGSTPTADENENVGRGDQDGNTNAATHGAYSEKFLEGFVGPNGKERIEDGYELTDTPEGAKKQARLMAQVALEKFRVTNDERFLRRYEAICDKANIFPEDVDRTEHTGEGGGPIEVNIRRERYDGDDD
ncbi:hypothetical protein [Haloferax volcanii]|uniref:hypothetical protein n=1 Tax=Haloferax volcanii TaxID=2246 RepID=UPI00249B4720|nr:hypothetical protein [Haloferax alexandrinus]WEL29866.1 hypothetical protein HBNXHx_1760 [Haloferax alexandrinus]